MIFPISLPLLMGTPQTACNGCR